MQAPSVSHLCDLPALVISTQQRHAGWVASLEQQQQGEDLKAVVPTVHKVAHKNVVCAWDLAARVKQA